jgi:hypothetical protein
MKRVFFLIISCSLVFSAIGKTENLSKDLYSFLNLSDKGMPKIAFEYALKGFEKLRLSNRLKNTNIITIADYSQPSNKKRLYVIDLKDKKLLFNTYVAHGRNSGIIYATRFSNKEGSLMSSLGFFITGRTIISPHTGFSLSLNGVEKGINDLAMKRAIIMHGAPYMTEEFIKKYGRTGRSFGCPALPPDVYKPVIQTIKEGTCLFIYSPDAAYLSKSVLLN